MPGIAQLKEILCSKALAHTPRPPSQGGSTPYLDLVPKHHLPQHTGGQQNASWVTSKTPLEIFPTAEDTNWTGQRGAEKHGRDDILGTQADAFRQYFSAARGDGEGSHDTRLHYEGGQHIRCQRGPPPIQPHFTSSPQNTSAQKLLCLPGRGKSLYLQQSLHATFFWSSHISKSGEGSTLG